MKQTVGSMVVNDLKSEPMPTVGEAWTERAGGPQSYLLEVRYERNPFGERRRRRFDGIF